MRAVWHVVALGLNERGATVRTCKHVRGPTRHGLVAWPARNPLGLHHRLQTPPI